MLWLKLLTYEKHKQYRIRYKFKTGLHFKSLWWIRCRNESSKYNVEYIRIYRTHSKSLWLNTYSARHKHTNQEQWNTNSNCTSFQHGFTKHNLLRNQIRGLLYRFHFNYFLIFLLYSQTLSLRGFGVALLWLGTMGFCVERQALWIFMNPRNQY